MSSGCSSFANGKHSRPFMKNKVASALSLRLGWLGVCVCSRPSPRIRPSGVSAPTRHQYAYFRACLSLTFLMHGNIGNVTVRVRYIVHYPTFGQLYRTLRLSRHHRRFNAILGVFLAICGVLCHPSMLHLRSNLPLALTGQPRNKLLTQGLPPPLRPRSIPARGPVWLSV